MPPQPPTPPLSSATLRYKWRAYKFASSTMGTYVSIGGHSRKVAKAAADAWVVFSAELSKHGYVVQKLSVWVNRYIGGTTIPSAHGYGTAADVNYYLNGKNGFNYGWSWSKTDFSPELVNDMLAIRTNNGKQVFAWGGTWRTKQDYMHWYIACGPKDLAYGINYDSVGFTPAKKEVNMIKKTSNPAFQAAWDKAIKTGFFSEHTNPSDVVTAEKLAVFLNRAKLL